MSVDYSFVREVLEHKPKDGAVAAHLLDGVFVPSVFVQAYGRNCKGRTLLGTVSELQERLAAVLASSRDLQCQLRGGIHAPSKDQAGDRSSRTSKGSGRTEHAYQESAPPLTVYLFGSASDGGGLGWERCCLSVSTTTANKAAAEIDWLQYSFDRADVCVCARRAGGVYSGDDHRVDGVVRVPRGQQGTTPLLVVPAQHGAWCSAPSLPGWCKQ